MKTKTDQVWDELRQVQAEAHKLRTKRKQSDADLAKLERLNTREEELYELLGPDFPEVSS